MRNKILLFTFVPISEIYELIIESTSTCPLFHWDKKQFTMNRFILVFICLLFAATSVSSAQNAKEKIVYLKDGSVVKGIIIEQITNESLKVQTADGSVYSFLIDDIEKITKGNLRPDNLTLTHWTPSDISGYRGFVDIGYTAGIEDVTHRMDRAEFVTSHGYQFNPHLFFGAGAGIHYYFDNPGHRTETLMIPCFADFRWTILNPKASPLLGVKAGYSLGTNDNFDGGFYLAPSLGAKFMISKKNEINISACYSIQWADNYCNIYRYRYYGNKLKGITLKLGFGF